MGFWVRWEMGATMIVWSEHLSRLSEVLRRRGSAVEGRVMRDLGQRTVEMRRK